MKFTNKIRCTLAKSKLKLGKHSPEILLGAGIVGVVASCVLACVATTKVPDVVEETKESLDNIKQVKPKMLLDYSEEDRRKDLAIAYSKAAMNIAKLYLPAVAVGTLSITALISSNHIQKKRNAELAAAYSALSLAFKKYRKRVTDTLGEEADDEFAYGIKHRESVVIETDPDTGEKVEKKDILSVVEDDILSPYAEYFERPCEFAEESVQGNIMFLERQQEYLNHLLRICGAEGRPLFLNEVRKCLGFRNPTKIGQRVGWIYDPEDPNRDSAVDLRFKVVRKKVPTPDGGHIWRDAILLDYNVDGDVWSEWDDKHTEK